MSRNTDPYGFQAREKEMHNKDWAQQQMQQQVQNATGATKQAPCGGVPMEPTGEIVGISLHSAVELNSRLRGLRVRLFGDQFPDPEESNGSARDDLDYRVKRLREEINFALDHLQSIADRL